MNSACDSAFQSSSYPHHILMFYRFQALNKLGERYGVYGKRLTLEKLMPKTHRVLSRRQTWWTADVPEICRRFFSLPSLMLRHVCSSFFLIIILLHYTWRMVTQGKKSFGEGETASIGCIWPAANFLTQSRLCDNFCGSNSNEFLYMAPWIWCFGTMYRLYSCIYHIWVPN